MLSEPTISYLAATYSLIEFGFVLRAIIRPYRTPASRIAWVVVISAVPGLGVLAYILFGETNIGAKRRQRVLQIQAKLQQFDVPTDEQARFLNEIPEQYQNPFLIAKSISGFPVKGGNVGTLYSNSNETIDAIIADIDAATETVHLLFYIWLVDNNGSKMVDALIRAAKRGVICRVMVDEMGSRGFIQSDQWEKMKSAGIRLSKALPISSSIFVFLRRRIDLRNHRKIVVIDDRITYSGSQNCADPEFRVKPKYAPWVDAMIRFEGPLAQQNQHIFASDWMTNVNEDLSDIILTPLRDFKRGFSAQAFGTGPTVRNAAMQEMFVAMMYAAQNELIITTPYYVPDEPIQHALVAAAHRGVDATIIVPAKNDSRIVAAASESYYPDLLAAGVKIYEYEGGLLHTKSMTVDGCLTLFGSANMDRRSFDLNYENNVLLYDQGMTAQVRDMQLGYIKRSGPVTTEMIAEWSVLQRLWRNTIAMLGPLL